MKFFAIKNEQKLIKKLSEKYVFKRKVKVILNLSSADANTI
jgi:hypothetical protein